MRVSPVSLGNIFVLLSVVVLVVGGFGGIYLGIDFGSVFLFGFACLIILAIILCFTELLIKVEG